ncbi:MAG: hypothetical protein AAGG72_00005 [Pseudomonadota bacterium]
MFSWDRVSGWFGKPLWDWLVDLAFCDQARLPEWLSIALLLQFHFTLTNHPELASRDTYAGFLSFGLIAWAGFTGAAGLFQLVTILWRGPKRNDLRFAAMTISFAFWCGVTWAFWSSGVQTTANWTYAAIAFNFLFAMGYLLWKSTAKA